VASPPQGRPGGEGPGLGKSLGLDGSDDCCRPSRPSGSPRAWWNDTRVRLAWQIAPGTYLYRDKVKAAIEGGGATLLPLELPAPKIKHDTIRPDGEIGDVAVYAEDFEILARLQRSDAAAREVTLVADYQGCAERGICYPPQKTKVKLQLPALGTGIAAAPPAPGQVLSAAEEGPVADQDRIAAMLQRDSAWVVVASFFGIGLLLAFTPCVFPMIPILSGIIAGQGRHITARKAFVLSLVYVLAMALTYTVAGVLAGLFGQNLQAAFQNPWIIGLFAAVFVALAMSMFGFYELQLPSALQSRLSELSNRQEGGNLIGVAIMGLLSALIVGPCVAPPLAGALIYIGQTGDAVLGGSRCSRSASAWARR